MLNMFDRVGCTAIVDGIEYKDQAIGCFNGAAFMFVKGVAHRVEQSGFYFTDGEKAASTAINEIITGVSQ